MNEKSFLQLCQKSSSGTSEAFKWLLSQLEDPLTRKETLSFWLSVTVELKRQHTAPEMMALYHFSLFDLAFRQEGSLPIHLSLLQLPSTFAPEDWSFTFFEGLTRYKLTEFQDKIIVELGCGIGWITLALAKQIKVGKIYGLDINPKAVLCSRINLFMNSFNSKGEAILDQEGRTLLDRVEFHPSDLLEYCQTRKIFLDRVIGCIPQVLNPDPEFASRIKSRKGPENENLEAGEPLDGENDEFLHSLSNYTGNQGYIEDQFGLGLIARAIEESVDVLRVSGKIILNLGGRPGSRVLNRLFLRRGFTVRPVWRTRVTQAKDTDIRSLVSIEESTEHRFEFYMGQGSDIPVSAKTALAYAEAGGDIAHGLAVYEARLRDPNLPKILQFMRQPGYEEARNSLDLSYTEDGLAIEKISYLNSLADYLKDGSSFPYEETQGLKKFRERMCTYFQKYFKIPLQENSFLITPSRATLCKNILTLFKSSETLPKILMDSHLAQDTEHGYEVLEIPRSSDLLCELMEKLRPPIAIYSMPQNEAITKDSFLRICETAEKSACRIFIDISELIELSSTPSHNGIFRYLVKNPLPPHVGLICGLVKNQLYTDLEVCFLISENKDLLHNLENTAELTYSRTPVLSQLYYDRILQELIHFQVIEARTENSKSKRTGRKEDPEFQKKYISLSKPALNAFSHPAIQAETFARAPHLIRLDYGENCLSSPRLLHRALFEAFAKMHISADESDCTQEVIEMTKSRFILRNNARFQVTYGGGIAPLFSKIAENCSKSGRTLVFPGGAYGHFIAAAQYHGVKINIVPSTKALHFKLTAGSLDKVLSPLAQPAYVFLNAPLVNPTGALYSSQELHSLFQVIEKHGATLILDTVFSGLEFEEVNPHDLPDLSRFPALRWILLGGLSKEFAAGGLRIGFAISSDSKLNSELNQGQRLAAPHPTLKFALKRVYQQLLQGNEDLLSELTQQRTELKRRAHLLADVLRHSNWEPIPSAGGLFLCATPRNPLSILHLEEWMRKTAQLVINPPSWTGIPGYFRFVLSTSSIDFDEAIRRLQEARLEP